VLRFGLLVCILTSEFGDTICVIRFVSCCCNCNCWLCICTTICVKSVGGFAGAWAAAGESEFVVILFKTKMAVWPRRKIENDKQNLSWWIEMFKSKYMRMSVQLIMESIILCQICAMWWLQAMFFFFFFFDDDILCIKNNNNKNFVRLRVCFKCLLANKCDIGLTKCFHCLFECFIVRFPLFSLFLPWIWNESLSHVWYHV